MISKRMIHLIRDNVIGRLTLWANIEFKNIQKEINMARNIPFAFQHVGNLGEELALYMYPNSIGSGSKGGFAFDNREINYVTKETTKTREVKFVSLDGSKTCKICKEKAPPFQTTCCFCNGSVFKLGNDSRCTISAASHVKYKMSHNLLEYILFVSKYDRLNNSIRIRSFKINSNNVYFEKYIQTQYKNGKVKTCNLLPYSRDFHLSGPVMLFDMSFCAKDKKVHSFNLENEEIMNIPLFNENNRLKIFKNTDLKKYSVSITENMFGTTGLNYNEYINRFTIKNKSHGKRRGETNRS